MKYNFSNRLNRILRCISFILLFLLSELSIIAQNDNSIIIINNSNYSVNNSKALYFGWQLQSNNNDIKQTAYQIEIYSDISAYNEKIWDSEKVLSSQSQGIKSNIENVIKPESNTNGECVFGIIMTESLIGASYTAFGFHPIILIIMLIG